MFYGREVFDPWLIIYQLGFVIASFYVVYGIFVFSFTSSVHGVVDLHQVLGVRAFSIVNAYGWPPVAAVVFQIPVTAFLIYKAVGRAKKCLDFTVSLYSWHLIAVVIYDGPPTAWEWWLAIVPSCVVTVLISEWLCMRRELEYIPVAQRSDVRDALNEVASSSSSSSNVVEGNGTGDKSTTRLTVLP